jgi:hypothetical protein
LNAVAGRVDEVIKEFENELITGVSDWEILTEHFEQSLRCAILGIRFQLEEFLE